MRNINKFIEAKTVFLAAILLLLILIVLPYTALFFGKITVLEFFLNVMPRKTLQGVNILAIGVDNTKIIKRSDTIMILHLDTEKAKVGILSIPRDTRVNIPGVGFTKINHAYAYGGVPLLQKTVSELLSIPINYYVKVDLKGVEKIVDEIGGVTLDVPKDLYYVDEAGDLYVNLKKGKQKLDGKTALEYLRFRHDIKGDIGRIKRQQSFVKAFVTKFLQVTELLKYPNMIVKLSSNVKTNLSVPQVMSLATYFSKAYKEGRVFTETVPGAVTVVNGVSYWRPNMAKMDGAVEEVLFGFVEEEKSLPELTGQQVVVKPEIKKKSKKVLLEKKVVAKLSLEQPSVLEKKPVILEKKKKVEEVAKKKEKEVVKVAVKEKKKTEKVIKKVAKKVEVKVAQVKIIENRVLLAKDKLLVLEVLNGNGADFLAQHGARFFKGKGFKVKRFDNAGNFKYQKTLIVDWKGNLEAVLRLANYFFIDPENIIVYDRPQKGTDITIVLGKDWAELKKKMENKGKNEKK
ncbi:LCP family protein [bacterium]|nr:LCP family protein [bacterium]MBT4552652.1 LCP family protein [bacterium]MBT7087585.1 LCP family protein [bacterium]